MKALFKDRTEAGLKLASCLSSYRNFPDAIVLGLPRGGVPVAFEVALALHLPLDVFLVRKLGMPGQEELAIGAVASGGAVVLNERLAGEVPQDEVAAILGIELAELARRETLYRGQRPFPRLNEKTIIVVDDGLATGMSMRAAISALRKFEPERIIAAAPVGSARTREALEFEADEVVLAEMPGNFSNVGEWYEDFSQTGDEEVIEILRRAAGACRI